MRLVLLPAAILDLAWVRSYCGRVFPEGAKGARPRIRASLRLIRDNPELGHPTHRAGVRELVVPRTPFSLIYRVRGDRVELMRVWDQRADRSRLDVE
jgi:plasmid stabilization system protein ParE